MPQPTVPDFRATVPSPFATPRQGERFLSLVRAYFHDRRREATFCPERFAMIEGDAFHGLVTLAQVCAQAPLSRWERLIRQHLDQNDTELLAAVLRRVFAQDYAELQPSLGVRLQPEDFLDGPLQQHLVCRTDLPGTVSVLMFDLGPSTCAVPAPLLQTWRKDRDACFAAALANLAAAPHEQQPWRDGPPGGVQLGGFCASSLALCSQRWPVHGCLGTLFAIPTRDSLLLLPLDRTPEAVALRALALAAHAMFRKGPHSLTPHLYLRTPDGAVERQQIAVSGDSVQLASGRHFAALRQGAPADG